MSPLRIIIIAILIYIGYRLIVGGKKTKISSNRTKKPPKEVPTSDILEEDPVCRKLVPRQQAVQYEHQGKTHYFCSKKCSKTFKNQQGDNQ